MPEPEKLTTEKLTKKCRGCDAPIIFARSKSTGKAMPFDAEPNSDGAYLIVAGQAEHVPVEKRDDFPALYRSHFASCPKAQDFRGRRAA